MVPTDTQRAIEAAVDRSQTRVHRRLALSKVVARLANSGRTDKQIKARLQRSGVDLVGIAKKLSAHRKKFEARIEAARRPPDKRRPTKAGAIYAVATPPSTDAPLSFPVCLFPPNDCTYSEPGLGYASPPKAEFGIGARSTGVGGYLGVLAAPWVPPKTGSFWYGFVPPLGGTLAVIAQVSVTGSMTVASDVDHWTSGIVNLPGLSDLLPSIYADAAARLFVRVHQDGVLTQTERLEIGHVHCDAAGGDAVDYHDDLFQLVLYAQILSNAPVVVEVGIEIELTGHSEFAWASASFSGSSLTAPGVIARALCLNLTPTLIL